MTLHCKSAAIGIVLGTMEPFFFGELHYTESKHSLLSVIIYIFGILLIYVKQIVPSVTLLSDISHKDVIET